MPHAEDILAAKSRFAAAWPSAPAEALAVFDRAAAFTAGEYQRGKCRGLMDACKHWRGTPLGYDPVEDRIVPEVRAACQRELETVCGALGDLDKAQPRGMFHRPPLPGKGNRS
jgi:hypothetical protein